MEAGHGTASRGATLADFSGRRLVNDAFGGPGFVAQVAHKLRAYTWNVVHRYTVELVVDMREVGADGRGTRERSYSRAGFCPRGWCFVRIRGRRLA
jgi:hypothetical protein